MLKPLKLHMNKQTNQYNRDYFNQEGSAVAPSQMAHPVTRGATDITSHPSQTNLDRYSDREGYLLGNFSRESCRDGLNSNLIVSDFTSEREQLSSQPIANINYLP